MLKCPLLESCFFYGSYGNDQDPKIKSLVEKYCHDVSLSELCARHDYLKVEMTAAPADYGPKGPVQKDQKVQ